MCEIILNHSGIFMLMLLHSSRTMQGLNSEQEQGVKEARPANSRSQNFKLLN